jgi:hypothetical protein
VQIPSSSQFQLSLLLRHDDGRLKAVMGAESESEIRGALLSEWIRVNSHDRDHWHESYSTNLGLGG